MGKHKPRTLRKRKINRKKRSTLKHRPLKYKKHYRGGGSPQSSRTPSPSNYSLKGMYSRLKSSLGITPHSISLNKIVKTVLKDIPKEEQDQFITTLKSNLTKWVKDLGHETSTIDQHLTSDNPILDHTNIDHRNLNLSNTNLNQTNLDQTNLDQTNLDQTNLDQTNLDQTNTDDSTSNLSNSNSQTDILPEQIISNSQISN